MGKSILSIEDPRSDVESKVHENWPSVLSQENSLPADLWPQILQVYLGAALESKRRQWLSVFQAGALDLKTNRLSFRVQVLFLPVDLLLDVLD